MPKDSPISEGDISTETSKYAIPDTDTLFDSSQDIFEDVDMKDVDIDEVLDEICQTIADLSQLSLTIVQQARSQIRPVYIRVERKHMSEQTLDVYKLPWKEDPRDPNFILIKKWIDEDGQEILFEHTRKLREAKMATESLLNPDKLEKLNAEAEEPQRPVTTPERTPSPPNPVKGMLLEEETNVDPEIQAILELQGSRSAKKSTKKKSTKKKGRGIPVNMPE